MELHIFPGHRVLGFDGGTGLAIFHDGWRRDAAFHGPTGAGHGPRGPFDDGCGDDGRRDGTTPTNRRSSVWDERRSGQNQIPLSAQWPGLLLLLNWMQGEL